ncbi:muellerian-inhibiting factor [Geospiza fortis]|uniref:Muellerian-inhibiting factor n=1 Tax=Geospiza fortis TaxID=48883 RepID=A0A8N5F0W9_GEOFO|nr:muellerian-inhibiting factor [Geospiza fortis]
MSALRGLLLCLVLLLPSAALPRKEGRDSLLELSLLEAEGRKVGNGSSQETPRSRRATRLFSKPEPGAKCPQGVAEEEEEGPGWPRSSPQPWPLGGLEGPVCRVRMEQDGATPRQLEVVGVLSHYESSFIKLLRRRRSWDGSLPGTFGLCRPGEAGAAPHPLQRIHEHVLEPGLERFLVLHLEEVQWEAQVKLRFQLVFQAEVGRAVGELQAAVMLFYLGRREGSGHPQELLASGPGLPRDQRLCLSRDTQYLALAAAAASVTRSAERLRFSASLTIHGGAGGAPLPRTEVQQLLFGSDDKCFTRMTPVLLLLAKSRQQEEEEEALAPSSYLSAEGVVDTAPYPLLSPPQAGTEELPTPTIDLRDSHFIIMPTMYAANNCEGPCRTPMSARMPNYFSHTVMLLGMQDRGSPLRRAPCCVPVRYSDQLIISLSSDRLEIRKYPNMVAEECGCR